MEIALAIIKTLIGEGKTLLLMGHSLGGSIAARVAHDIKPLGLFVLDTIEGIALAAMPKMRGIVNSRPKSFSSAQDAIRYISCSGELSSTASAVISSSGRVRLEGNRYVWITNLLPSEQYWTDWFKGFADIFLKAQTYKILCLPNINHLDTPFTIGHMSGKFQLEIVPGANHCLHEDQPDKFVLIITKFLARMASVTTQWKVPE